MHHSSVGILPSKVDGEASSNGAIAAVLKIFLTLVTNEDAQSGV